MRRILSHPIGLDRIPLSINYLQYYQTTGDITDFQIIHPDTVENQTYCKMTRCKIFFF